MSMRLEHFFKVIYEALPKPLEPAGQEKELVGVARF